MAKQGNRTTESAECVAKKPNAEPTESKTTSATAGQHVGRNGANAMAGRTLNITHKGMSILVKERQDDSVVLQFADHMEDIDKKFGPACRYALTWLLDNAGEMRGNYERSN